MQVVYQTNLDEAQHYLSQLYGENFVPQIGARIQFQLDNRKTFELEVHAVTYKNKDAQYVCVVELHIPSYFKTMSMRDWMDWFEKHKNSR
jgi:hypothetical protein